MKASLWPAWLPCRVVCVILITMSVMTSCAPPPPVGSEQWLLSGLQRLTDEGLLFEPNRVEQVLDLHVTQSPPTELYDQPPACSSPTTGRSLVSSKYPSSPDWLKPTSQGIKEMFVPAFAINPAEVSGNPSLTYGESTWSPCSDRYNHLAAEREATLTISGLPAFACYKRPELEQKLGVKDMLATDGVDSIYYAVTNHDQRSANLSFTFRAGAPCALSVELRQGVRYGRRWERANSKWQRCRLSFESRYDQVHGRINGADDKAVGVRMEAVVDACGSLLLLRSRT